MYRICSYVALFPFALECVAHGPSDEDGGRRSTVFVSYEKEA